jgi:hypothetical protein
VHVAEEEAAVIAAVRTGDEPVAGGALPAAALV